MDDHGEQGVAAEKLPTKSIAGSSEGTLEHGAGQRAPLQGTTIDHLVPSEGVQGCGVASDCVDADVGAALDSAARVAADAAADKGARDNPGEDPIGGDTASVVAADGQWHPLC